MNKIYKAIITFSSCALIFSCTTGKKLTVDFSASTIPAPPDYSQPVYWAALPDKKDSADHIPAEASSYMQNEQANAAVDVFYIHPTTYYGKENWNADFTDKKINENTNTSLLNQASAFNGSCQIYAPQYRQATYRAYFHDEENGYDSAFALAYEDVKNAFSYYLDHYNKGRSFIIAAHSQGSTHAIHLMRDYIDGKDLQKQMVAAYIIGMPVYDTIFRHIEPCRDSSQTGCFISWRSYLQGAEKDEKDLNAEHIVVTNPLSWTIDDTVFYDKAYNKGGIAKNPDKIYPEICSAGIHNELLWVSKPDIPFKFLLYMKNYHIADYNLFWVNIRQNVSLRIMHYKKL